MSAMLLFCEEWRHSAITLGIPSETEAVYNNYIFSFVFPKIQVEIKSNLSNCLFLFISLNIISINSLHMLHTKIKNWILLSISATDWILSLWKNYADWTVSSSEHFLERAEKMAISSARLYCWFDWDDNTTSVHSANIIREPRKPIGDYVPGEKVRANIPSCGLWQGVIVEIGGKFVTKYRTFKRDAYKVHCHFFFWGHLPNTFCVTTKQFVNDNVQDVRYQGDRVKKIFLRTCYILKWFIDPNG